jgi:hypothetical protein
MSSGGDDHLTGHRIRVVLVGIEVLSFQDGTYSWHTLATHDLAAQSHCATACPSNIARRISFETHYAKSGDVFVAYQVTGRGSIDLMLAPGFIFSPRSRV